MNRIYCISGLGADERIFSKLQIRNAELIPLKWEKISEEDDMRSYALKLSRQINEKRPIILGLSFGGMLATELSKLLNPEKVFLVSSAKTRSELGYSSFLWRFIVNRGMVPYGLFNLMRPFNYYRVGIKNKEDRKLIADMNNKMEIDFLKNAIRMIVNWKNNIYDNDIVHIHGTKDKVIRPKFVNPTHWVEGGEHIMILNKAEIVSRLIEQHLS